MVDEATFTAQAEALLPMLYRVGMGILHTQADAQDAVQQGLMKAWAAKDRVQPDKLRVWMTRSIVNECRNIQRHRMRVTPVEEMIQGQPFEPPDVDVAQAIADLPEKWRIPFLLKYAGQYTEKEIALALRLPPTTVKSRLHSARQSLRETLTDKEVVFP